MNKKVLVISSTLRKNGNSEILALEFLKGAKDNGNNVEFVSLQDKEIKFCKGFILNSPFLTRSLISVLPQNLLIKSKHLASYAPWSIYKLYLSPFVGCGLKAKILL